MVLVVFAGYGFLTYTEGKIDRIEASELTSLNTVAAGSDDIVNVLAGFWIAGLDPHFKPVRNLIEHCMGEDDVGNSTWYQHIDLPWPAGCSR